MKKRDLKIISDVIDKADEKYKESGMRYGEYVVKNLPERIVRSNPKFQEVYKEEDIKRAKVILIEIMEQ